MELALGTVQFGLAYGIAGRAAAVGDAQARAILRCAWDGGVRLLDTAAAYGDIEARLDALAGALDFSVVSKLPAAPDGLPSHEAAGWVREQVGRTRARLGDRLCALLFHRAEDLERADADLLWQAAVQALPAGVALGVSCYDPRTLAAVAARHPVALAQVPANAFDRRFDAALPGSPAVPLHLRSVFLQGLLLMPPAQARTRLPAAAPAIERWHRWCAECGLSPLAAALAIAKSTPRATHCVVGVDDAAQLEAILAAWQAVRPLAAPELALDDPRVIDPRLWELAA